MQFKLCLLIVSLSAFTYCNNSDKVTQAQNQKPNKTKSHTQAPSQKKSDCAECDDEDEEINALLAEIEIEAPEIEEHSAFVTWFITWRNRLGIRFIETPVGLKIFDYWLAVRNWAYGIESPKE